MVTVASTKAMVMVRRRPHWSEKCPKMMPPKMAPIPENAVIADRRAGEKCHCLWRKVGYISCVPCEANSIMVMKRSKYKKSFQCERISRLRTDQPTLARKLFCQTSDSFTRNRMKSNKQTAGRLPKKKSGRHPTRSKRNK